MRKGVATALIASAFTCSSIARAADVAPTHGFTPNLFTRVSRSIVKVRSGDDWQTGFVYGSRRHIVTSYFVANESGTLVVVDADQKTHEAHVVAWSKDDDLAVLEVITDLPAAPLETATGSPWTPEPIAVLYQPQEPDTDSRTAKTWNVPIVMSGTVARVLPDELDIDVNLWGRPGDYGAPVLTESGKVVGVVSQRGSTKRRAVASRAERIQRLFDMRGKQEAFSRSHRVTGFGGLFVTPGQFDDLFGAGIDFAMQYAWFVLELAEECTNRATTRRTPANLWPDPVFSSSLLPRQSYA
jgi:S1-C subfamily serine protease